MVFLVCSLIIYSSSSIISWMIFRGAALTVSSPLSSIEGAEEEEGEEESDKKEQNEDDDEENGEEDEEEDEEEEDDDEGLQCGQTN